jgi:hypothetical protein
MTLKKSNTTIALPASKALKGGKVPQPAAAVPAPAAPVAPTAPTPLPPNGAPPPGVPLQQGGMDPVSGAIMWLNTNPYLIGMLMLLLNLGGRFLAMELTKKQEAFLQATWVRPAIFFTVIFIATRNLVAAFWVTLLFFFIIWVAANENSPFCMIPSWCGHDVKTPAEVYEANIASLR